MSSINEKLGLGRAGTRAMMKLPDDRAARSRLTSAVCPTCGSRGIFLAKDRRRVGWFACPRCAHSWNPDEGPFHGEK
jgi:predicted RNA-binding Zn-ribbon protein involved in translation (DUF1610 family)